MRIFTLNFLMFFLLMSFLLNGQNRPADVSAEIGEKIKYSGTGEISCPAVGGEVYTLELKEKNHWGAGRKMKFYQLQKFDSEMNLSQSGEIRTGDMQGLLSPFRLVEIKGKLMLLSRSYNQKKKEEVIVGQEISRESLQPAGGPKTILTISAVKPGYLYFYFSPDKSKTLLMYEKQGSLKAGNFTSLFVLDENLTVLWGKETRLSEQGKIFLPEKSLIDNEGNVFLLSTIFKEKRKTKRAGRPDYQYRLVSYKDLGRKVNEYAVQLKGKFLTDIQIVVNDRQDITGAGFYSGEDSYRITGSYYFKIDGKSNELRTKSVKEFSDGFQDAVYPGRSGVSVINTALKYQNYRLSDIVLRKDGSALLVGEQYVVSTRKKADRGWNSLFKPKVSYHYEYGDIVLVNINSEGEIDRFDKIDKKQHSVNDAGFYSSFALSTKGDNVFFLFNRNPEQGKARKPASWGKEALAVLVKVDKQGNKFETPLPEFKNEGITLMPKTGISTGPAEFVLIGKDKERSRLVKLKLNSKEALMAVKR